MRKTLILITSFIFLLTACAPGAGLPTSTPTADGLPVPGRAMEYALTSNLLPNGCTASNAGTDLPNERVLELREDGEAYLEASGRVDGWQVQFDCEQSPKFMVGIVVRYETLAGATLSLSREWHGDVWERIAEGTLEQLDPMPRLGDQQIVFTDANGTIGVEFVYRNLYFFITGTAEAGEDNYDFFAEVAAAQLARAESMVP